MARFGKSALLSLVVLAALASARSETVGLMFEGIPVGTEVGNYYLADWGITFTNGIVANGHWGPDCLYMGGGPCAATIVGSVTMDVYPGFGGTDPITLMMGGVGMYFNGLGSMSVYDGLDGTGVLLATGPIGPGLGEWDTAGLSVGSVAHSVVFDGNLEVSSLTVYDPGGGPPVPEPTTLMLLATGLAGGFVRRRFRA